MDPLAAQSFVKSSHEILTYYVYAPFSRLLLPRLAQLNDPSRDCEAGVEFSGEKQINKQTDKQ